MKKSILFGITLCLLAATAVGQSADDLAQKATEAYQQKHFREAAVLYAKALEAGGDDPGIAYNGACSWALAGDRDRAFEFLAKAAELGYANPSEAEKDKDFESLRGDPRWTAALALFKRKAEERVLLWDSPAIATAPGGELSDELKVAGLSKLWAEARYDFVYPQKLVEIDWDGQYVRFIPKVRAAASIYDYYRVLQMFCALLKDGHSNVSFPADIYSKVIGRVGLRTRLVEDKVMVIDVWDPELRALGLAPGMEVVRINGLPARGYAEEFVAPYQSASTPQDLASRVYDYALFMGPVSETLKLALESADGRAVETTVRRKLAEERKAFMPKTEPFQFRMLDGNIAYVVLSTFNDNAAADGFLKSFAEIAKSDALIIDVRDNGGGNTGVGYRVLAALVDRPFLGSRWATRDYRPAIRAWGQGDRMYSPAVESVPPDPEHRYGKPVVVLSSGRTYSAAEDFLVAFDTAKRGPIIGEASGGSTGQPLSFKLPGGGSARICSKRDTYADGKAFVGVGVQPQIVVHPTVADLRAGKDRVLEAALAELRTRLARGDKPPASSSGQEAGPANAGLQESLPSLLKDSRVPGLQIALIKDGQIVWHGNFGVRNSATGEPVTGETIFEAASLTKPFFAYYAMTLVDQGLLELDKPLIGYVSTEFTEKMLGHPLDEKGFRRDWAEKITARHVLSHSSGMPHGEQATPFPLFFEPGTKWKYSADGYFFLQKVIEHLKGEKLENLMQKEVLDPLGMTRSCLVWREDYEKTMANGHDFFGAPQDFRKRTESHAGASLYTTAEDYAKFVCAVLEGRSLKPETLKEMLRPQIDMEKEKGLGWGLGFGTQSDNHGMAIWQWGDYGIFRNYVMAYPAERSAIVYLTDSFFGLGISPELVAGTIGGKATGSVALNYRHYDWPVYRAGWAWAENGKRSLAEASALAREFPEAFSKDGIEFLSAMFEEAGRLPEFIPALQFYAEGHPRSGQAQLRLTTAFFQAGDRARAKAYLKRAGRAKEDKVRPFLLKWDIQYIKALDKPKKLGENYLKRIAGSYGARQLELRQGRLFYFRKGGSSPDYRPLVAMSKNTFVLETMSSFRLRIEFDKKGNPVKAVGLYDDGSRDETPRDK